MRPPIRVSRPARVISKKRKVRMLLQDVAVRALARAAAALKRIQAEFRLVLAAHAPGLALPF